MTQQKGAVDGHTVMNEGQTFRTRNAEERIRAAPWKCWRGGLPSRPSSSHQHWRLYCNESTSVDDWRKHL